MGMTMGTVTDTGIPGPAAYKYIQFWVGTYLRGTAQTDANGVYAIYLAPGIYTAKSQNQQTVLSPPTLYIPAGVKIQNLEGTPVDLI